MATTTAVEHVPKAEHGGGFPPFDAHTFGSQLFWLVLVFVALYLLMSRLALPRVGRIIERREHKIAGDLAEAEQLKRQSDEAVEAYEKALAEARNRAQAIASETRDRQAAEAEKSRKALEASLSVKLAEAEKQIAATKQAAMSNVRGIAADAARAIVERLIGKAPDDKAVAEAVAAAIKG